MAKSKKKRKAAKQRELNAREAEEERLFKSKPTIRQREAKQEELRNWRIGSRQTRFNQSNTPSPITSTPEPYFNQEGYVRTLNSLHEKHQRIRTASYEPSRAQQIAYALCGGMFVGAFALFGAAVMEEAMPDMELKTQTERGVVHCQYEHQRLFADDGSLAYIFLKRKSDETKATQSVMVKWDKQAKPKNIEGWEQEYGACLKAYEDQTGLAPKIEPRQRMPGII